MSDRQNDTLERLAEEFGVEIRLLEETASTNDLAADPELHEGDVVMALHQSEGRGQRGNVWSAERGANLTFSMVLEPEFLPAERQFLLSQAVSLAIVDWLGRRGVDARIKWPNDIYVKDRKIAGILIEHTLSGAELQRSVVGIGLNINQVEFDPQLPNPISLAMITGSKSDIFEALGELYRCLLVRYSFLVERDWERIESDCLAALYLLDEPHTFSLDGQPVEGTIRGIGPHGELEVEHPAPLGRRSYLFKEIVF
ncbi:biotin--[acetyl-CoA-carboxylase] ligase [Bacteroidia bacterium]|nr:biotin--[acetyl-CoA-carboxylase] ligase [Bacteroidia bacterium]